METGKNPVRKKKVCIIGGGPAGLVSLRWVLNSPFLTGTLFEQRDDVGGMWNYKRGEKQFSLAQQNLASSTETENNTSQDPEWTTTIAMYDDLTCNLPYPLMELLDFPYKNPTRTFLTQQEVHAYFQNYTNHFDLWPNIQLNTTVISVSPETPIEDDNLGKMDRWIVITLNLTDKVYTYDIFDAVMVCVGKNTYPILPNFPGQDTFQGKAFHCKFYQNAEEYRDKRVVLIGLNPSSADLTLQLSKSAQSVTVCHQFPGGACLGLLPQNARETKNAKKITQKGVITEEDEEIACDVIIFCTGYGLKFPFLNEHDTQVQILEEKYIPHLYKMTVYTKRPSLAILNMALGTAEIIVVEAQARYFVAVLEGQRFRLPGYLETEAALAMSEERKRNEGLPYSQWFELEKFGISSFQYFQGLCEEVGIQEECCWNWPVLDILYTLVFNNRIFGNLALYKKDVLRRISETEWEYTCSADRSQFPKVREKTVKIILDREFGTATTITTEDKFTVELKGE